ncbi:glutamate 5-kinase [Gallaecimonas sp. GXIMD4217]|uniref:glutamate 5-kinase n=1 Tax=Gallaecimonas sp. GXIMD4217 TaxID=3131927 RepID=UPI00311AF80B
MQVPQWQRAVLKVGSALIAPDGQGCSGRYALAIATFVTQCRAQGKELVLVSSGSVAAGRRCFDFPHQQLPIHVRKAMASVGQNEMMANWSRFFDFPCAQVLLTHGDLRDRTRYVSVQDTLNTLLEHGCLPIVNENDAVATDELRVGDNDNLAAMVATVVDADALFILSDVDGLFDRDPNSHPDAKLLPVVERIDEQIHAMAGGTRNQIATGGMKTKIEAAEKATSHGVDTYIFNGGNSQCLATLLAGENPGTLFRAHRDPLSNRKHWLRHTLKAQGRVLVDEGAALALIRDGASLLGSGIVEVQGDFERGDAVVICQQDQARPLAKGISRYSAWELAHVKGRHSDDIDHPMGAQGRSAVIHRDDMMILEAQ